MNLKYLKTFAASTCSVQLDWDYTAIKDNPIQALTGIACALEKILFMLRNLVLFLGIMFIIIGGITLATSSGDPDKVIKGRQTITWAIVAIIAAILVWVLMVLIAKFAGANTAINNGGVQLQLPDFKYDYTPTTVPVKTY